MQSIMRPLAAACVLGLATLAAPFATAGDDKTISAGKLARDAKDFYGKTVTVKAEVEKVVDAHTFTLDEDALLAGSDVLVLVPRGMATTTMVHDQKVLVTGKVRRYVVAELDRDYDWFEDGKIVNMEKEVDFKTRPVLIATSVRSEDGRELMTPMGDQ
jgi:hypothetical protein